MANILVVDDERDVVTLMKFILEKDGHIIWEAFNGVQALEKLGIEPENPAAPAPDLLILDVMMPQVDGYTVAQRMAEDPRTRSVPIVVLTARDRMKDLFKPVLSVAAYIEKPFDPKALRDTVVSILAQKRP
ncbi:MAG: response regulator [Elusimicrobiota bacterium]|jgi:CheY-like chemotaxis protein